MREIFRLITVAIMRLQQMRSAADRVERAQIDEAVDHLQSASDALAGERV